MEADGEMGKGIAVRSDEYCCTVPGALPGAAGNA